jgi:hypothetical protein
MGGSVWFVSLQEERMRGRKEKEAAARKIWKAWKRV